MVDHHSEQQLARGFLPYRHRRGCCEVRGGSANLWHAAARALGFEIGTIRCPDQLLVRQVSTLCPGVKSLVSLPGRLRPPQHLPDIVFCDLGSIPLGQNSGEYWGAWLTPHLFFYNGTDDCGEAAVAPGSRGPPAPPKGWTSHSVGLSHADTGGSTSSRWDLAVWYPSGYPWVEPLTWKPRGGTPLLCCVNNRVAARPLLGTRRTGVAGQGIEQEHGFISDFGLFPAWDPTAQVLLESSGSPSGYGSRSLLARELGDLWDVPILFMDYLEVGDLMSAICRTPPSKLLHTGADLLLTEGFQGGFVGIRQGLQGKGSLPGPRPRSDSDLGLAPATKRLKLQMVCEPLAAVADEYVGREEVIKGDSQKSDDAVVPDHLWLRAFVLGYGVANHAARHWRALGRAGVCEGGAVGSLAVGCLADPAPPLGWRGALSGLRLFALRYWHSRVTRGYVTWRRANVPLPAGKQLVQYR